MLPVCTEYRFILQLKDSQSHLLINYKDTNPKFRLYWCLIEFVEWRYSQPYWYFRPAL
jgi:hypothetical protein